MLIDIKNIMTSKDLCKIFGVSHVTLIKWRKNLDLPKISLREDFGISLYNYPDIIDWARKCGKPIKEDLRPELGLVDEPKPPAIKKLRSLRKIG